MPSPAGVSRIKPWAKAHGTRNRLIEESPAWATERFESRSAQVSDLAETTDPRSLLKRPGDLRPRMGRGRETRAQHAPFENPDADIPAAFDFAAMIYLPSVPMYFPKNTDCSDGGVLNAEGPTCGASVRAAGISP